MFRQIKVPTRSFYCELKHRPPDDNTGDREELIETLILEVPRLKNSNMEKQWAIAQIWNKLHDPEFIQKNINQVFIFTAQFGELIIRLEVNQFDDEPARKLAAPEPNVFEEWQHKVAKQFKKIHGIDINKWQQLEDSYEAKKLYN